MQTQATDNENRPFYELDDEELIIAQATDTALSNTRPARVTPRAGVAPPGVVLCANLDPALVERLDAHAKQVKVLTLLDHALILNACMCTTDRNGEDRYGLATLIRHENGLLQLDRVAPADSPRSIHGLHPEAAIEALATAAATDRAEAPEIPARRISANELLSFAPLVDETNRFLTMRRLGLSLLPNLTRRDLTADALKEYAFTLRIFVNAIAARWTLLPWSDLRRYTADDADVAARAVIKALQHEVR